MRSESSSLHFYRPQRKFAKVMFHRCPSVHRGVSTPLHAGIHPLGRHPPGRHPPPGRTPPLGTPPQADNPLGKHPPWTGIPQADTPLCNACWDTVNKWAVRIPLECILVGLSLHQGQLFIKSCSS